MRYSLTLKKQPIRSELKAGVNYRFCRCGKSDIQPMCDKYSHYGSKASPLTFTVERDGAYYLCGCKKTAHPPFCDGSHKK